jgi:2-dehydropantoate 2-reductase
VRLASPSGEDLRFRVRATDDPEECGDSRFALVLVKSWQTERAAGQLSRCLPVEGVALTLQNGLGNREALVRALGAGRVGLGTATAGATLLGPGWVRPGGEGEIHAEDHPRLPPLTALLSGAGFSVSKTGNVESLVWGKLAINAAINPLTALLRVPNGELLERPEARELMRAVAREAAGIASAKGIRLPFDDPTGAAESVARRTAGNTSSMLQDVLRGAPTEVDAICGGIVAAAHELGLEAPVNETLWRLVKAMVNFK